MIARLVLLGITAASLVVAQAPPPREWPTYGSDLASSKYSPLTPIDGTNFSSLRVAWRAPSRMHA